MKRYFAGFLALFLLLAYANADVELPDATGDTALASKIALMDSDSKAELWNGYLILPYHGPRAYRFVGIAFAHEDYHTVHAFVLNKKGVYVFYGKIPDYLSQIRYRLVVDSVWQSDPSNPQTEVDKTGVLVSLLDFDRKSEFKLGPQFRRDGYVDFYLRGQPHAQVFITGSFSQWDPFVYAMTELSPGLYLTSIPLLPGRHYYTYLFNGQRMLDPTNLHQVRNYMGEMVNVVDVLAPES